MSESTRSELTRLLTEHAWYVDAHVRGFCLGCLDENRELRQFPTVGEFAAHLVELITERWTLAEGIAVGYISTVFDGLGIDHDVDGQPMWDTTTTELHHTEAAAREELGLARLGMPDDPWKLYALTEIGDEHV